MDYLKEFCSKLQNLDKSKNTITVFNDFLTLSTCSIANVFYRSDEIEQKYLTTAKQYTKEQVDEFSKLLALLVKALEEEYQDFLGKVYMQMNFGNSANGQFFTPYHVSKLMSEINFAETEYILKNDEILTLSEPCCGSGGIIIAFADVMRAKNYNYQRYLFVEAIDIDENCFKMAYIQLALLGIPARVILGDTISLKFKQILYTPLYFINGFSWRLKENTSSKSTEIKTEEEVIKQIVETKQLSLFGVS